MAAWGHTRQLGWPEILINTPAQRGGGERVENVNRVSGFAIVPLRLEPVA